MVIFPAQEIPEFLAYQVLEQETLVLTTVSKCSKKEQLPLRAVSSAVLQSSPTKSKSSFTCRLKKLQVIIILVKLNRTKISLSACISKISNQLLLPSMKMKL